jgi:hypothetical protein
MRVASLAAVFGALALLSSGAVSAVEVDGSIKTDDDVRVAFISSFCFDTSGLGKMMWQITPSMLNLDPNKGYELLIFDDEPSSFPSVWPLFQQKGKDVCKEIVKKKKNQRLLVNPNKTKEEEFKDTNSGHQWFIAVADCELSSLDFKYNINFENADGPNSAELGGIVAPTVFYAIFMALAVAAFALITLRTMRSGLPVMSPMIHRHAAEAVFMMLIANICAWAWTGSHEQSALSAMLFFQGLCQFAMMWMAGFLAVANKTLDTQGKFVSYGYFYLAPLYFIFYFIMGLLVDPFPGVVGATAFANGVSIVASIIRFIQALLWVALLFLSWRANKHQGGADQMHVLQWFVFGFAVFMWLVIMPIAVWANYTNIYSCSPPSLVAGYAVAAIFDGCILVLMLIALDPAISRGVFGDILGPASILEAIMPHKWNEMDWSTTSGGFSSGSTGYSTLAEGGIGSDDFGDSATTGGSAASTAGSASGGATDGAHESYQTL